MTPGLDTRSDNREHRGLLSGEQRRRKRGNGGRAELRDQPTVHHGRQDAGSGIEQHDRRRMGGEPEVGVARKHADELCAERGRLEQLRGHHGEEPAAAVYRDDRAHGLDDLAGREARERSLHRLDHVVDGDQARDLGLTDEPRTHGRGACVVGGNLVVRFVAVVGFEQVGAARHAGLADCDLRRGDEHAFLRSTPTEGAPQAARRVGSCQPVRHRSVSLSRPALVSSRVRRTEVAEQPPRPLILSGGRRAGCRRHPSRAARGRARSRRLVAEHRHRRDCLVREERVADMSKTLTRTPSKGPATRSSCAC